MRTILITIALLTACNVYSITWGPYKININGVERANFFFYTENDSLLPNLSLLGNDTSLMRYIYIDQSIKQPFLSILNRGGWKSIVPYAYVAVYDALGRLLKSISLDDQLFFVDRPNLGDEKIVIKIFTNQNNFRLAASKAVSPRASAYWLRAKENSELGLYLDEKVMKWAKQLSVLEEIDRGNSVAFFNQYVRKLFFDLIGHEMFHAIQERSKSDYYLMNLFKEGTAVYAQENIAYREELVKIQEAQENLKSYDTTENFKSIHYYPYEIFSRIFHVVSKVDSSSNFSLSKYLLNENCNFIKAPFLYDLSYVVVDFMKYDKFFKAIYPLTKEIIEFDKIITPSKAQKVDSLFIKMCKIIANKTYKKYNSDSLVRIYKKECMKKLDNSNIYFAYQYAQLISNIKPLGSTGPLCIGEVFNYMGMPFSALYYNKIANNRINYADEESPIRIKSWLADNYEKIGNINDMLQIDKEVNKMQPKTISEYIIICTTRIRGVFYTIYQGTKIPGSHIGMKMVRNYSIPVIEFIKNNESKIIENPQLGLSMCKEIGDKIQNDYYKIILNK